MTFGVRDLAVRYPGRRRAALAGVSFDLDAGSVTALVGGDGAGKTTALRALVGAVRPAAGDVRRPDRARIGYMSAGPGVYRDLTVMENLAFAAAAYGVQGRGFAERAGELLARTDLESAADRLAGELSGGMRQKLALALAVLHRPELVVLDEPTTGVDPVSRAALWGLITRVAAEGAAVALATSYLDEAERAAAIVALDAGRPLVAGAPGDVLAAMPGAVLDASDAPAGSLAWRYGRRWRLWSPDGKEWPGTRRIHPRLEDAVIVAALARARPAGRAAMGA